MTLIFQYLTWLLVFHMVVEFQCLTWLWYFNISHGYALAVFHIVVDFQCLTCLWYFNISHGYALAVLHMVVEFQCLTWLLYFNISHGYALAIYHMVVEFQCLSHVVVVNSFYYDCCILVSFKTIKCQGRQRLCNFSVLLGGEIIWSHMVVEFQCLTWLLYSSVSHGFRIPVSRMTVEL